MLFIIISAVVAIVVGIVLGVVFSPEQSETVAINKLDNGDISCTKAFKNLKLVNSTGDKQ